MTKDELRNEFDGLYAYMAMSKKTKYMHLFGEVMKDIMAWMIDNKPDMAEKYVETLRSIKWQQYLTRDEANEIVNDMEPAAAWPYETWLNAMKSLGLEYQREPVFNCYAIWVVKNAEHSDSWKTIASMLGIDPSDTTNTEYINAVYRLAMDKLTDADGMYSVRRYFYV